MRITVRLTQEDGNVFHVIGRVYEDLKKAGQRKEAEEFKERAFHAKNYDHVFEIALEYVDIS